MDTYYLVFYKITEYCHSVYNKSVTKIDRRIAAFKGLLNVQVVVMSSSTSFQLKMSFFNVSTLSFSPNAYIDEIVKSVVLLMQESTTYTRIYNIS